MTYFKSFGDFQDAIDKENTTLFHSLLSPYINSGLLDPMECIVDAISYFKKAEDEMNISLAKTTDILKSAEGNYVRVGFAAESQNLVENAKAKVASKKLDLIVANDITAEGSGFGSETNQVTFIDRYMQVEELPLLTKYDVSNRILDRVRDLIRD